MTSLEKLRAFLRELFQLDLADLDFGIYRTLRLKGDEVEAFLSEQLRRRVHLSDGEIAPESRDVKVKAARELLAECRSACRFEALRDLERLGEAEPFREQCIRIGGWLLSRTKLEDIHDRKGAAPRTSDARFSRGTGRVSVILSFVVGISNLKLREAQMRRALMGILALSIACGGERAAEEQPAADSAAAPRVEIVRPADGDITGPNVLVQLEAHGVRVAPAQGIPIEGEGHHHLFVDKDLTPLGDTIPREVDGIIHLGTGAEEFELKNLSPGSHRVIAVLAYGDHIPMPGVAADTVDIFVQAP